MWRWRNAAAARASRTNRARVCSSSRVSALTTFKATGQRRLLSTALYVTAIAPRPSSQSEPSVAPEDLIMLEGFRFHGRTAAGKVPLSPRVPGCRSSFVRNWAGHDAKLLRENGRQGFHGQAEHVGPGAFEFGDDALAVLLRRVAAGLVQRVDQTQVGGDFRGASAGWKRTRVSSTKHVTRPCAGQARHTPE